MARSDRQDLIRSSTDLVVLSVLQGESLYGYAIIKQVQARSEGAIRLTPGVLYPLLHEMERQGLLLSTWDTVQAAGEEDGPGRRRKWYRLSAKGKRRLEQRIAAHRTYQGVIESFLPNGPRRGAEGAG